MDTQIPPDEQPFKCSGVLAWSNGTREPTEVKTREITVKWPDELTMDASHRDLLYSATFVKDGDGMFKADFIATGVGGPERVVANGQLISDGDVFRLHGDWKQDKHYKFELRFSRDDLPTRS